MRKYKLFHIWLIFEYDKKKIYCKEEEASLEKLDWGLKRLDFYLEEGMHSVEWD